MLAEIVWPPSSGRLRRVRRRTPPGMWVFAAGSVEVHLELVAGPGWKPGSARAPVMSELTSMTSTVLSWPAKTYRSPVNSWPLRAAGGAYPGDGT